MSKCIKICFGKYFKYFNAHHNFKFILVFTKRTLSADLKPQDSFAKSFSKMHLEFWMDKGVFLQF